MTSSDPRCLDCGALLDEHTGLTKDIPSDGDVSVCLYCGAAAFYMRNGRQLRRPTPAEEIMLAADERIERLKFVARVIRFQMGDRA